MTLTHQNFTIFPAIDLRQGQVVRLRMGELSQQTTYSDDPSQTALRWLSAGARWLHVVNLDGAFGETYTANQKALEKILKAAQKYEACVQFGRGLRSLTAIERALDLGVSRVVLGTVLVEQPRAISTAMAFLKAFRVAISLGRIFFFSKSMIFMASTFLISHSPATGIWCPVRSVFPAITEVTRSR